MEARKDQVMEIVKLGRRISEGMRETRAPGKLRKKESSGNKGTSTFDGDEINRFIIDNTKSIVVIVSPTGKILFVNRSACISVGYKKDEIIGRHISAFLAKDSLKKALIILTQEFLGKSQPGLTLELKTKSGELRQWDIDEKTIFVRQKGKIIGLLVSAIDVTESKKAEKDVKESEERFKLIMENTSDLITLLTFNLPPKYLYVNRSAEKVTGFTLAEFSGKNPMDFVHPDDRKRLYSLLRTYVLMRAKEKIGLKSPRWHEMFEYRTLKKDGSWVLLEGVADVVGDKILIVSRDITERKKAEETLRESEKEYRSLVDNSLVGIYRTKTDGKVLYANDAFSKIFGFASPTKMIGKDIKRFYTNPEDRRMLIEKLRKDGLVSGLELNVMTNKGIPRTILMNAAIEGDVLSGMVMDITERKKGEAALQKSEERFKEVADSADEFIWEVNASGLYTYASPAANSILGYDPEEIVGKKHFYDLFIPSEREKMKAGALAAFSKKETIKNFENSNVRKNGTVVILETNGSPILDSSGKLLGYRGMDKDITERKKSEDEMKKLNEQLTSKIQELERFNKLSIGRELRMIELKKRIQELEGEQRPKASQTPSSQQRLQSRKELKRKQNPAH